MQHERKTIRTIEILSRAGRRIREAGQPLVIILLFGMVLPDLLLTVLMDLYGAKTVDLLRTAAGMRFDELIGPSIRFLMALLPAVLLALVMTVTSYLAIVHIAVCQYREMPVPSGWSALRHGLRKAIPRGILQLVLVVMLLTVGHALVIPAIAVAVLSIMAPVVLVAEGKGAWRSLLDALTLRYARDTSVGAWSTFASLLYITGLFYLVAMGVATLGERLMTLDVFAGAPRALYLWRFEGLPFGPIYAAVTALSTLLEQMALAAMPFLTASLYFAMGNKRVLGSA
jgi:hypothetical protein